MTKDDLARALAKAENDPSLMVAVKAGKVVTAKALPGHDVRVTFFEGGDCRTESAELRDKR